MTAIRLEEQIAFDRQTQRPSKLSSFAKSQKPRIETAQLDDGHRVMRDPASVFSPFSSSVRKVAVGKSSAMYFPLLSLWQGLRAPRPSGFPHASGGPLR